MFGFRSASLVVQPTCTASNGCFLTRVNHEVIDDLESVVRAWDSLTDGRYCRLTCVSRAWYSQDCIAQAKFARLSPRGNPKDEGISELAIPSALTDYNRLQKYRPFGLSAVSLSINLGQYMMLCSMEEFHRFLIVEKIIPVTLISLLSRNKKY